MSGTSTAQPSSSTPVGKRSLLDVFQELSDSVSAVRSFCTAVCDNWGGVHEAKLWCGRPGVGVVKVFVMLCVCCGFTECNCLMCSAAELDTTSPCDFLSPTFLRTVPLTLALKVSEKEGHVEG